MDYSCWSDRLGHKCIVGEELSPITADLSSRPSHQEISIPPCMFSSWDCSCFFWVPQIMLANSEHNDLKPWLWTRITREQNKPRNQIQKHWNRLNCSASVITIMTLFHFNMSCFQEVSRVILVRVCKILRVDFYFIGHRILNFNVNRGKCTERHFTVIIHWSKTSFAIKNMLF